MKATGIVRRIDDLGRVVIPKEIRRTLRIREGDPLEIFTERDGSVILHKYSPVGEMNEFAREFTQVLSATSGHTAMVCDKDSVIAAAGAGKKALGDKPVSAALVQFLEKRKSAILGVEGAEQVLALTADEALTSGTQAISPIIVEGDVMGGVVIASAEGALVDASDLKLAEVAAGLIALQMSN